MKIVMKLPLNTQTTKIHLVCLCIGCVYVCVYAIDMKLVGSPSYLFYISVNTKQNRYQMKSNFNQFLRKMLISLKVYKNAFERRKPRKINTNNELSDEVGCLCTDFCQSIRVIFKH